MSSNAEAHPERAGKYRPPRKLAVNEFVGELRNHHSTDSYATELHVRYAMSDGLYVDWSISLNARLGSIDDFRSAPRNYLPRRRLQKIAVNQSTITHFEYDPESPHRPPKTTIHERLRAGQDPFVDEQYVEALRSLRHMWGEQYGSSALEDKHSETTFAFAAKDRDPNFRDDDFGFVRNTLIALESDELEEVVIERGGHYFAGTQTTLGAMYPDGRMRFVMCTPGRSTPTTSDDTDVMTATGRTSAGLLIDAYYRRGWTENVDELR